MSSRPPRPAWQPITCWACGYHIRTGEPVAWSAHGWWGCPACVDAYADTEKAP